MNMFERLRSETAKQRDERLLTSDVKLDYYDQLNFKKWVKCFLNVKGDPFYFDFVQGVNAKTSRDIPGLVADGSLTVREATDIVKKHFAV